MVADVNLYGVPRDETQHFLERMGLALLGLLNA